MSRESFRDTLVASAAELGYSHDRFRPLEDEEAGRVASAVEATFGDAANGAMVGWWYSTRSCPLPTESRCFREGGWRYLLDVAFGPTDRVWLLTENWGGGPPITLAFESTAEVVLAVLGNTFGFEYIVVDQQFRWLFAEDHEDCVMVAGTEAVRRLQAIPGTTAS
jgi:hypothetical protein